MKRSLKYFIPAAVISAVAVFSTAGSASAQASTAPLCVLDGLPLSEFHKSFTIKDNKVTGKFTLRGDANCQFDMTLATFETPSADATPFKEQKLFSSVSGRFGPGTHTLTTTMPDCYYQIDLFTGKPTETVKGTRLNDYLNRFNFTNLGRFSSNSEVAHTHDALIGGDKSCEKPVVPEKPEKPEKPVVPVKPAVEAAVTTKSPEVLPSTGPAAIAGTFAGVTASAGAAHMIVRRFRRR